MSSLNNKIRHKDLSGVKQSVCGGANLSKQDRKGNTPLHIAAEVDAPDIAAVLIQCGAPLDVRNEKGIVPADVRSGTKTRAAIVHAMLSNALGGPPATKRCRVL